ncbi:MAG TPA: universal stress protein, partial [Cyclobacteriaceae bacterium]|nr:universal stress protein [Cyclobacteriaceae bacterium]
YVQQLQDLGYTAEIKIGFGNPRRVIPVMVNDFGADLLVMGAHGHRFFKDLIFGTTLDTVRHRVDMPVLIVRDPKV